MASKSRLAGLTRVLAAGAICASLGAQDAGGVPAPRPNRVAWMEIFPDPLPSGQTDLSLEATSQFLRPDRATSGDGRTHAILDGEEWQLAGNLATPLLGGYLNLRWRVAARSGGIADQAFTTYHTLLGTPSGGRELAPKYQFHYRLERDGVVVADLRKPDVALMEPDLAWVRPFGNANAGGRFGVSVQLPTGERENFTGTGGTSALAGGALWKRSGRWHGFTQAERVVIGLPKNSPYKAVLTQRSFSRAWVGGGYQGEGDGFFGGLGVEVSVGYIENPYHVDLTRVDKDGMQQYWIFTHRALPRWRFGLSEEAGSYFAPDLTLFATYKF